MIYHYAVDKIQVGAIHELPLLESYRSSNTYIIIFC
jgi:hypothetical protein